MPCRTVCEWLFHADGWVRVVGQGFSGTLPGGLFLLHIDICSSVQKLSRIIRSQWARTQLTHHINELESWTGIDLMKQWLPVIEQYYRCLGYSRKTGMHISMTVPIPLNYFLFGCLSISMYVSSGSKTICPPPLLPLSIALTNSEQPCATIAFHRSRSRARNNDSWVLTSQWFCTIRINGDLGHQDGSPQENPSYRPNIPSWPLHDYWEKHIMVEISLTIFIEAWWNCVYPIHSPIVHVIFTRILSIRKIYLFYPFW